MVTISDTINTDNVRVGLSKNESLLLSSLSEKGRNIFNLMDVVAEAKCSYSNAKVLANRLTRKKWIIPLKRGTYLIVPLSAGVKGRYTEHEFIVASHLVSPYYIAYWNALNYHRLTEQTPFTVFVATTKRVKSREVLDVKYSFITIEKKKFFGFSPVAIGSDRVNISNVEKTLADALDHPEYCGGMGEVAKCFWNAKNRMSPRKIVLYATRMGNRTIIKRLGYLSEKLDLLLDPKLLVIMLKSISKGISLLDPSMPRRGKYVTKWKILVNVPDETLDKARIDSS